MKRDIIFVDASVRGSQTFLGIYDDLCEHSHTFKMKGETINSAVAEKSAILYGLMYIRKKMKEKSCIIYNDNQSATIDEDIIHFAQTLNTEIRWIPREQNKADEPSRSSPKLNKKEALEFTHFRKGFESLYGRECTFVKGSIPRNDKRVIKRISNDVNDRLLKRKKEKASFCTFSNIVVSVCDKKGIDYKKGVDLKVRKLLLEENCITIDIYNRMVFTKL